MHRIKNKKLRGKQSLFQNKKRERQKASFFKASTSQQKQRWQLSFFFFLYTNNVQWPYTTSIFRLNAAPISMNILLDICEKKGSEEKCGESHLVSTNINDSCAHFVGNFFNTRSTVVINAILISNWWNHQHLFGHRNEQKKSIHIYI